jgi:membrane-associated protease RseP (regulator of RpoE activity)
MNIRRLAAAALVVVLVWAAAITVLLVSDAAMAGKVSAAPLAAAATTTPVPPTTPAPARTPVVPIQPRIFNRAWLGVTLTNVNAQIAQQYNLSDQQGVVIVGVTADSPAAQAGLKEGDEITSVNGVAVSTAQAVVSEVGKVNPGDTISLSIVRGGQSMTITATAGQAPATLPGGNQGQFRQRVPRGNYPATPPELNPLQGVPQGQLFSHDLGSSRSYKDKDGNVVTIDTIPGVVTSISSSSITLTPNNPQSYGGPYSIDDTTIIRAGRGVTDTSGIAVNDQVTVTTVAGSNHASAITKGGFFWGGYPLRIPGSGFNGLFQAPQSFFQNLQRYLGGQGGPLNRLIPQLRNRQQQTPGQGL